MRNVLLVLLGIVILLMVAVNLAPVQNFLAQKAVHILADKLKTKVSLQKVKLSLFNEVQLQGLYVEDHNKDTLLYAGMASVKITDWFFLKKTTPVLSYVGLENANINLYRTRNSDQWNYQFVIDAFASKSKKPKDTTAGTFEIDLRQVQLTKVKFQMIDAWTGSDIVGGVDHFEISARKFDLKQHQIDVELINSKGLLFGLRDYKGGRPPQVKANKVAVIDTTPFNTSHWKIKVDNIALESSRFFLDDPDTKATPHLFDATHMDVTNLNFNIKNILIVGDTITADLNHFSGNERCGLVIKNLKAKVKVSPIISECKELRLVTGNSDLSDYYAMKYQRFPDFLDYINKVVMVGHLKRSELGIEDIAFFAPALKQYSNISVMVSGSSVGTVANLKATGLKVEDGITKFSGDLAMKGLPDIDKTFIDYKNGIIQTNGMAAYTYAPQLKGQSAVDLKTLKNIVFKGSFTGYISNFNTKGVINSNLGNLTVNADMKLPYGKQSAYKGTLVTSGLDLGKLLNQPLLGPLNVNVAVDGRGFDPNQANINIKGNVQSVYLNGYNYKNIKVDGLLASRKFDGKLVARDTNLMLDFDGIADFSEKVPAFDMKANIGYADIKALGLSTDRILMQGEMTANFEGSNIDNFIGAAQIFNLHISQDSVPLSIDSITLVSRVNGENFKEILLSTNELNAKVSGKFSLLDLPKSAQLYLSYYLPEYVKKPLNVNEKQQLNFEVDAKAPNDIIALFNKNIQVSPGVHFAGSMDMSAQQLTFNGTIPSLAYGRFRVNDIEVKSTGTYAGFNVDITANGLKSGDNDLASTVQFQTKLFQDSAKFQFTTTTPTTFGSAEINGVAYADRDSFFLSLMPSQFYINSDKWSITDGNKVVFAKDYVNIKNLNFESGLQSLRINSDDDNKPNELIAHIKDFDVAPLNRLLGLESSYLDGRINGSIQIDQLLKDQLVKFDVIASDIRINTDTLGELRAAGNFDVAKSLITLESGSGLSYKNSKADVEGTYSLNKSSQENIDANINFNHAEVKWAEPFLTGYVHKLSGELNGSISIKGNASNPVTVGIITLNKVGFIPDITGVHYNLDEASINVTDSRFDMGSILVKDDDGNEGTLTGNITHTRLSNFNFRLNMRSDNIKVVDLQSYQNVNFYGDVKASVQLRLSGPANNLTLNIFATPQKNSHLFIPMASSTDVSEYNYVHFKQYGQNQVIIAPNKNKFNIHIDAVATPDLEATIILDPATGEQIWAKGSGNIILEIPSEGDMKMNGNYIIDDGKYNYSFKQLQVLNYKQEFIINPNSAIKWNGDIDNADLDVSAYAQIKARLYDLIISEIDRINITEEEKRDAQIMQMVNVNMNMKGSLKEPELHFKIDLVENRSVGTYAYQKLQRINADDKQLYTQVASLLLLQQFVPPEGINNTAATAGVINNMSELVSSAASSQFTNFANKLLGMEDLSVDVKYKYYSLATDVGGNPYINRNEAGVNLRKAFLKNRLVAQVGGVYDWGRTNTDVAGAFAGDFRIQYLLSEDGRIWFNVFRTSNYDALSASLIARQGVGLSYRRSFNGLLDFFRSQDKIRHENELKMENDRQQKIDKVVPLTDTSNKKAS